MYMGVTSFSKLGTKNTSTMDSVAIQLYYGSGAGHPAGSVAGRLPVTGVAQVAGLKELTKDRMLSRAVNVSPQQSKGFLSTELHKRP